MPRSFDPSIDESSGRRKRLTPTEALARVYKYCAYQERSHREVKDKLYGFGLSTDDVEEIVSKLITDGFINEERFARALAGGKFRMKKWGRVKIESELNSHGVSKRSVTLGLSEINSQDYRKTLVALLKKKMSALQEPNMFKKRDKAARFAIGKGYESELVWEIIREYFPVKGSIE